jgi:hypothetical protein
MDNQFKAPNTGLMGWFEETMPAFNRMMRAANLTIDIQHEEDFTVIPVTVYKDGEYQYEVEDGIKLYEKECFPEEDDFDYSDEWRELEDDRTY